MKIVKPFRCSLLQKTYCFREQSYLCTKPIIFFDLGKPKNFISEIDGWKRFLSCLPKNYGFDDGLPKGNSEVLVVGSAHVPGGSEVKKMKLSPMCLTMIEKQNTQQPLAWIQEQLNISLTEWNVS